MIRAFLGSAITVLLALPQDTSAQQRWSVEGTGGVTFATQTLGGTNLSQGFGLEGTVAYRFMPHVAVYAGWDWNRFPAENSFAGSNMDFEETGYAFGLRFDHPFRGEDDGAGYRLRLGGTLNHIEVENQGGHIVSDSGHGLGWELGTGVIVPFGNDWRLTPGLRYRSLGRTLSFGGVDTPVDLTYVTLELGFSRRF